MRYESITVTTVIGCVFITGSIFLAQAKADELIVATRYGSLRGVIRHFANINKTIKAVGKFLGIPYAASPTGALRFMAPQKVPAWKPDIYNASFYRSICIQPNDYNDHFWPGFSHPDSEDCLFLNVFTPLRNNNISTEHLYPVMVYIHGGGYEVGTPVVSPGDVIPLWGVVLVTIQYRLGALGFATTGDSVAPGNYGMLDQIEALKWVQENIKAFGGDKSKVTIFGESAGGSSVGLLVLSPLSANLFHHAIAISGSELSPFAFGEKTAAISHTKALASRLGCSTDESSHTIACLRSVEPRQLLNSEANVWRPVADGKFLADSPEGLRKSGTFNPVKLMMGFTSQEGSYFFPSVINETTSKTIRSNTDYALSYIVKKYGQTWTPDYKISESLLDAVVFLNTPWPYAQDVYKVKRGFSDIITDSCVAEPAHSSLLYHSGVETAYMYEFTHRSKLNPLPDWMGVLHKDDTPYQFGFPLMNLTVLQKYDEADRNVSDTVITLFTNFAKYGNPTPHPVSGVVWETFNSSNRVYMRIAEAPVMAINYHPTRMAFWSGYYKKLLKEDSKCKTAAVNQSGTCSPMLMLFLLLTLVFLKED